MNKELSEIALLMQDLSRIYPDRNMMQIVYDAWDFCHPFERRGTDRFANDRIVKTLTKYRDKDKK